MAIFGTLQLPDMVNRLADWVLLYQSESILSFGFIFFQYLNIASLILVAGFIIHFIMRTLWIGMIGLVSVYPNGVVKNLNRHSESFSDQLVDEFSDINRFNKKLDDNCSVMLSITISLFLTMVIFNFWIFVGIFIWTVLESVFGDGASMLFSIGIGLIALVSVLILAMNDKKYRDKTLVKKIHYPISSKITKYFFLFFYSTYAYISYTIVTNYKKEISISPWKMAGFGIFFGALGYLSTSLSESTNQRLFFQDKYHSFLSFPDKTHSNNYQNEISNEIYQFGPSIQSEIIFDDFLRIQILCSRVSTQFIFKPNGLVPC